MIFIDNRVGSREMMRYLPTGSAELTRLQFADAMFIGRGPDEIPTHVGIEVKRLDDILNSMVDGRLTGHQLPGLLRDYHVIYLIVEGHYRPNPETGVIQVHNGKPAKWVDLELGTKYWTARELHGFCTTIETRYNVHLRRSFDRRESAGLVLDLYHWWTGKIYEAHRSAQAIDFSGEPLLPASTLRRVAAQLPLIGWKRSGAVADHFNNIAEMVLADEKDWKGIEGIGPKIAAGVVQEIWRHKQ